MELVQEKLQKLNSCLAKMESVAVAFSGGVDSTFLLKAAHNKLGKNAVAVNVVSQLVAASEKNRASKFCAEHGIELIQIEFDALSFEQIKRNDKQRCYHCKKEIFLQITAAAKNRRIAFVVDGSNTDDTSDYRPGMKALEELQIHSPLKEAGLCKNEIRALCKEQGLEIWNAPSAACLASRIAYGQELTEKNLCAVDKAEDFLRQLGLGQCRARIHGNLARIEVLPEQMQAAVLHKAQIVEELRRLGFDYIALDLAGYRVGSMNEILEK